MTTAAKEISRRATVSLVAGVAAVVLAATAASPAQAQITNGLQLYFDFETNSITNVVAGDSGYTPSVTTRGTPESGFTGSESRPLLAGNALDLVRSENGWVNISDIGSGNLASGGLDLAGSFTMSSWAYLDLAQGVSNGGGRYFVWEGSANYDVSFGSAGTTTGPDNFTAYVTTAAAVGAPLERNTWNHIAQVFSNDGTDLTSDLYVNGQLIGSRTTALSGMDWVGLRFGNSRGGGGRAWEGMLDEIAVWDRALSADEVTQAYTLGSNGLGITYVPPGQATWDSSTTDSVWNTATNWDGGSAPGEAGDPASTSTGVATFREYSTSIANNGVGIDMDASSGSYALGAIQLESDSGDLRIGNYSFTDGVLRLNGATTGAGENTIIDVRGGSNLTISNSPDSFPSGDLDLSLGSQTSQVSVASDRTVAIDSKIVEAAAGADLTLVGGGTLALGGANTYTGTTTVSDGTLRLSASNVLADTSNLTVSGSNVFDLGANSDTVNTVTMNGAGSITGSGTLTATALDVSNASGTATVSAGLGGATAITKTGAGTLLLSGTNSHTGGTAVNEGTVVLAAPASLSSGSTASVAAGATLGLRLDAGFSGTQVSQLMGNTLSGVSMDAAAIAAVDTAGADASISEALSGSQPFAKLGDGTLTLTGVNSFSGGATIAAGTVAIGDGGTAGSLTGDVAATGTLAFNRSDDVIYAGVISGTGGVAQNGFGTLTLTGANTYSGNTAVSAGTLAIDRSDDATYSGAISGAGAFVKQGSGTLALTGASSLTGDITVNAGTLVAGRSANSTSPTTSALGDLTAEGRTVTVNSGAKLDLGSSNSDVLGAYQYKTPVTLVADGGTIQNGSGGFMSIGDIELKNGGTFNTQNGANIAFQTFNLRGSVTVSGTSGSSITTTGSSLTGLHLIGTGTTFNVADTADAADLTVSAPLLDEVYGTGSLVKAGAGRMVLSAGNSYSGGTTISAGTLAANAASALGSGPATLASGATLEIGHADALQASGLSAPSGSTVSFTAAAGTNYTIGSIAGGTALDATGSSLTVGGNNGSSTFSGSITADSLTKAGTGSLTVTGANTLGGVNVSAGTLVALDAAALGTGTLTLSGGRLQYAGTSAITNEIVLSGAAASNAIDAAVAVDYLVVGGGGGGAGRDIAGGGGAGGVLSNLTSSAAPTLLSAGDGYAVTVGAGGNGGVNAANGANGGSSSFAGVTALGGGGGGRWNGTPNTGASGGGGGGFYTTAGAAGTAGQGFAGGAASGIGGGGGGAGGPGQNGRPGGANKAGDGGVGLVVPIMSDELATTLAIGEVSDGAVYFGGGGGGSPHRNNTAEGPGLGGLGGGGDAPASNALTPQAGSANTGGGGANSRSDNPSRYTGGSGGSGVVVVRYAGSPQAAGGTVTEGTGADAGYTFHTFKTTGSTNLVLTPTRTISGDISGTGGFSFASPGATLTLSGTNSYSGGTVVSAGTLTAASATALGTGPLAVNAGGNVAFDAPGISSHALPAISGAGTLSAAGKSLSIGADNSNSAFAGSIAADSLTKQGTGDLGLTGSNTLTSTTISSGRVTAASNNAFGTGSVTLSGGDLRLGNNVSLANAITLSADAASTTLGGPLMDYLIVGGGGGGAGRDGGGGGGGGGVLSNLIGRGDALPAAGSYEVTVGAGGAGGVNGFNSNTNGRNGGDSILGSLTAVGGGGGGFYAGTADQGGSAGGSGGGGGRGEVNPNPGAGTAGQGFAGGAGTGGSAAGNSAGGGGGAGGAGQDGVLGVKGGDGGSGIAVAITGTEAYYGGGGGGSVYRTPSPSDMAGGAGGIGGGGAASASRGGAPAAGTANTGGGGGASRNDAANSNGAAGGSGIVVVRYLGDAIATGGTVTAGTGSSAGYTLHTFTSGTDTLAFDAIAATLSGDIGGAGGFTWDTPGTLTLSGTNTYSGGTILSAGTLTAGSASAFGSGTITLASGTTIDLGDYAISNTITNNGGTILNAGNYGGSQSVDGDATFSGDVGGTVQIGNGGVGRFQGQVGGRVEIAAGGIAELDDSASVGSAAEFVTNGTLRANRATDLTIDRPISGTGSLQKQGAGRLVLSGTNTYTGGTDVDAGALVVNGSILGDVALAAGSRLGGSGSIAGTVGGAGVFSPGNSPGIIEVGSIDPSAGTSYMLEFTGSLADWDAPTASVNDVIRLTDQSPFTSAMTSANAIDVFFDLAGDDPIATGSYTGGFFTDSGDDFSSFIDQASFEYWVAGEFGTADDRQQFALGDNGALEWYTKLSAYDSELSVSRSVVAVTADFGAGDVNGQVTQFAVVPEPGTLALAAVGFGAAAALLRRRRTG
jgi:autotransporter-associated beta strand protein